MYQKKDFDFSQWGAFFAFSPKQYNEEAIQGIEYIHVGNGLVARKDNYKEMEKAFSDHVLTENKKSSEIDGIEKIILYEFDNYECGYTGDIDCLHFLTDSYNITRAEICEILKKNGKFNYR